MSDAVETTPSEDIVKSPTPPDLPVIPALNRLTSVERINNYSEIGWKNGGGKPMDADNLNHIDDGITSVTTGVNALSDYTKDVLPIYSERVNVSITNISNYLSEYAGYVEKVISTIDQRNDSDESDLSTFKITTETNISEAEGRANVYTDTKIGELSGSTSTTTAGLQNQIDTLSGTVGTNYSTLTASDTALSKRIDDLGLSTDKRLDKLEATIDGGEID